MSDEELLAILIAKFGWGSAKARMILLSCTAEQRQAIADCKDLPGHELQRRLGAN